MFSERGFDVVTVEEIASAAGVSHMTFYRHFPTKESVVLDDPYDPVIGQAVSQQDHHLTPLQRVRSAFIEVLGHMDESEDASVKARVRLAVDSPPLRARIWENNQRTGQVIVEALTDSGVERSEASAVAGAVLGATTAALLWWAESDSDLSLATTLRAALSHLESRDRQGAR